jgi:ubiquinone/menaquinone biosynthesis C-methylase UbiE
MTFVDAKQRFSNRVTDYVRYRPSYPRALLDLLREECGLCSDHLIADIGSGTGLLTKLFLDNGNLVWGVEPNAEMRSAGEEYLQANRNFTSVNGSAEATTLTSESMDFVTAGQAFHWFDAEAAAREFRRILKPGGSVVVVWQDRRMEENQFTRAYEDILDRFGIDYQRVKEAYPEAEKIQAFFSRSPFQWRELPNSQSLDWEGLCGRLRSSSFAPTEDHANFQPMMAELRKIFLAHLENNRVQLEYFVRIYFGKFAREPR